MRIIRQALAFVGSAAVTFALATGFYTHLVLEKRAAIGLEFTPAQKFSNYLDNLVGFSIGTVPSYGMILVIALLIGFVVAAVVKRILVPLAPIAYPTAGAAAIFVMLWAVETFIAKGSGAFEGASGPLGIGLQCFAGFIGGVVFALTRGRAD